MPARPETLRAAIGGGGKLYGRHHTLALAGMGRALDADLSGAHVLLRTRDQLYAALALIELDGVAARIVIAPPDVKPQHLPSVIERAAIDVMVSEDPDLAMDGMRFEQARLPGDGPAIAPSCQSEWVLFTSGTTGMPKMVAHSLEGLSGAIRPSASDDIVWGTFYDIRRYGGLQILLRALLGQASLILSDADESVADFLDRLGRHGVTHLTGTPSHWRRALMSPANNRIAPRYVRLSGEIADQAILDSLKARFPDAAMGHAYASTEAGVGFEVTDGLEGFPASFIGRHLIDRNWPVEMKVENGTLHVRSPRTAREYIGGGALKNDGWVDTGDMVEPRGDRCYFAGRAGGIINVGGLKINPEEVEAVINRHPGVRMSRVSGRKNPITGAIVIAEVVLTDAANDNATFKQAILEACRENLPAFKVPAMLRFVPALELTAGGKLSRHG
ncbi:MAG TPA: fatty acid--CoA ligase family protein [Rhizomicrobium sp.]|nr:fatty acid--CoA ligase family protein [Rhizomicrobium sp.]